MAVATLAANKVNWVESRRPDPWLVIFVNIGAHETSSDRSGVKSGKKNSGTELLNSRCNLKKTDIVYNVLGALLFSLYCRTAPPLLPSLRGCEFFCEFSRHSREETVAGFEVRPPGDCSAWQFYAFFLFYVNICLIAVHLPRLPDPRLLPRSRDCLHSTSLFFNFFPLFWQLRNSASSEN